LKLAQSNRSFDVGTIKLDAGRRGHQERHV
jgi:hypothetical protein